MMDGHVRWASWMGSQWAGTWGTAQRAQLVGGRMVLFGVVCACMCVHVHVRVHVWPWKAQA